MKFMMESNLFLLIPVGAAFYMQEWVYFYIALGAIIFSSLYHYLKQEQFKNIIFFDIIRSLDWTCATIAYGYMYYYIFTEVNIIYKNLFAIILSVTMLFFWYGFKIGDYKKTHPWFHIITAVVSGLIVIAK